MKGIRELKIKVNYQTGGHLLISRKNIFTTLTVIIMIVIIIIAFTKCLLHTRHCTKNFVCNTVTLTKIL